MSDDGILVVFALIGTVVLIGVVSLWGIVQ
jgi:hypothetical protein